jgi:hypothetical protein
LVSRPVAQLLGLQQLIEPPGHRLAGKVLSLVDLLPFLNVFHGKPLIYATLWKTSIYSLGALLLRYCDFLAPFIFKYKDLGVAIRQWILREDRPDRA